MKSLSLLSILSIFTLMISLRRVFGYIVVIDEGDQHNKIVFNTSVHKLGYDRIYKINAYKSASFVHRLIKINPSDGQIRLKKELKCDGIYYPNLFTFYVDSTSSKLQNIDYYSLPLRVLISGKNCTDSGSAAEKRRMQLVENDDMYTGRQKETSNDKDKLYESKTFGSFEDGDILFSSEERNERRQKFIRHKKRSLTESFEQRTHRMIHDAKQWISETYASYAIHTNDKWDKVCLKKSQYINSMSSFLPKTILQYCSVKYLDVNDDRFKIEPQSGDLVASDDLCIVEPFWKLSVTLHVQCNNMHVIDSDHRLKIVFHHQELNDTDIAKRVKRELKNLSPYFEQALYVAAIQEEQLSGLVVTTVRARDPEDSPVVYSMVSLLDSRSQSMFNVDSTTGVITTAASLDRETMDVHYFRVIATDDSFPPRSGTTTLQVNILDCNDHSPVFESNEFRAAVREGISVGSPIITVKATDQDIGRNADIEYAIVNVTNEGVVTNEQTFQIDARSGTISTRHLLDREKIYSYNITVVATDMATSLVDRKSAIATVYITILDDNDNYPQFSERTYTVHVREDQWTNANNIIAHIRATDIDQGNNALIRYAIIGGNTKSQFSIDSMNGDVSLVKPLDYESVRSYRLVIRAQDGGSPSRSNTTQLLVNVLDANDNTPRFYTSQFQETVLENVQIGYNIVRVQAFDSDEGANSEISYSIPDRNDYLPVTVDSRTGWIYTTKKLDREEQTRYSFEVVATDSGIPPRSSSTSVVVIIQDINDNDPTFSPKYYEATVSEDQPPGTPVTTVTATDPDEDSRLHYEITGGNTRGRFSITSQNGRGLITIAQSLDYKQERRFALTVTATDSGQRTDTALVNINITDANNFAPVFENAPYSSSIFEDAPIGTTVLVVSASDNDVGMNARITYSLNDESLNVIGSNLPFTINPQTGAIVTNIALDRETVAAYLLTVTAKDGGFPPLSDTTDIEITITDINDNPPQFKLPLYQATIVEDALIGTSVLQISAVDFDMGLNGRVKYMLSAKDVEDGSFVIDSTSGIIRTNKGLDRESVALYHLMAIATDKGTPMLSTSVEVQIHLDDINDSPPTFSSDKIILYVSENSPVGSVVGEIHAHDPDEGVNAIVHYSIIGGDDSNYFSLVTRPGSEKAQLLTTTELDYESSQKKFNIVVRAASPPLRNDVHVEILVTDINDNAPTLRDFQIIFNNFQDCFPSEEIGRIPALDPDISDKLTYRILSGNNANLVTLNSSSGYLTLSPHLNTNVPRYANMEVSVSDGINEAKAIMLLIVRLITEDMLLNSITVRLDEMTEEAFLSPLLNFFLDGLAAIIPCPKENIYLFSIQDDTDINSRILNVSFSARRPDVSSEEFFTPQYLQERVYLNRAILARLSTVQVLPFDDNLCVREPCLNFEQCMSVLKFGNASGFIHSDTVMFRPIYPVNTFACKCPEGFTGSKELYLCDTEVDLCYSNPCQNGGSCIRREGGYTCVCAEVFTGKNCEKALEILEPCVIDNCSKMNGCLNHNNNIPHEPSYTRTCELESRSFTRNSFLTFHGLKQRHRFNIKLNFATIRDNGLLLYNGRYNEQHDFIALEVINGQIIFSFSLGDKIASTGVNQDKKLTDGKWHSVEIEYNNRTAAISVDDCDNAIAYANLGEKWNCANRTTIYLDHRCASVTQSCHRFLDLTGPLQVGGLPKIPTFFQIQTHDFMGCISNLFIDHKYVDFNTFIADNGTTSGCPQKSASCASEPCFNGGTCKEGWGEGWECECPDGFTGNACQESAILPWRFNGDGILNFNPLLRPIQMPWSTELSIRTRQKDAFLIQIQIGQNSSALVSLRNGVLCYTYNLEPMFLTGTNLADGNWHKIEIKWLGTEISLSVDYGQRTGILPMSHKIQGLYVGRIVIGRSESDVNDYGYYEGCIQDVRIGSSQSILSRPTIRENVIDGCKSNAKCPEKCPEHSSCIISWDEAHCECNHGYVGTDCLHVCTAKPCHVNGQCIADNSNKKNYRCACNSSLISGEHCEFTTKQTCPAGWWGERGCGPCKCDDKHGYHPDCDKRTGQCYCREHHYQQPNGSHCLPCDCYTVGSFGKSCNISGQCECRDGVIGRRCDSCSNAYAEVTLNGCEVVYDACPKSFSAGLWWPRTKFGEISIENCPLPAKGKGMRKCDLTLGGWGQPDMFNCTSEPFLDLRKQLSQIENHGLALNSFIAIKVASALKIACENVGQVIKNRLTPNIAQNVYKFSQKSTSFEDVENSEQTKMYGADLLITTRLLHELINYETRQNGLNLSHSQDKHYIKNLVASASVILDTTYKHEWERINVLTQRGPNDLVEAFNKYMLVLGLSQHDTYTNPFEIVFENMAYGLDIVTVEPFFVYDSLQKNKNVYDFVQSNFAMNNDHLSIENNPLTHHEDNQKQPMLIFPKYNNYILDKNKFDQHSKILIPIDILGIIKPEKKENAYKTSDYRTILAYAQYKKAGALFPSVFDETITRRWGIDVQIASPVISLNILIPSYQEKAEVEMNNQLKRVPNTSENIFEISTGNVQHHASEKLLEQVQISIHDIMEHGNVSFQTPHEIMIDKNPSDLSQLTDTIVPATEFQRNAFYETGDKIYNKNKKRSVPYQPSDTTSSQTEYKAVGNPYLQQPIKLQIWLTIPKNWFVPRSNPQCVRWNSHMNLWTRLGCQTEIPNYDLINSTILVNCSCNIVSSYAVIVDVIDPEDIPEPSMLVQITSYSAYIVSLPLLFGVILSLALLQGLQTNSNTIHQNLLFCIFLAELFFFIGIQSRKELIDSEFACKIVAISLHYTWLATFAWTTVDCIHLHRMLTEMRDINHGPMGFYYTVGYGAPALLVGLSVGVRVHEYGNNTFCWLSVYEPVVWWLVGPIVATTVFSLLILFSSVRAAFTIKDHVLGFGNLRTLLWLSVVSLPLSGILWMLALLAASENSQVLNVMLSASVLVHACFSVIGYCIINKRVRENLHYTILRCIGRKVPLLDSSLTANNSNQNIEQTSKTLGFVHKSDTVRRNVGISTSSTTSRSTSKTGSSPYRFDGQYQHTSTSTSNYNSNSDGAPFYVRGYNTVKQENKEKNNVSHHQNNKHFQRESDTESEIDGRSLELASSHSSDDEESRVGRNSSTHRSTGMISSSYRPNMTEHIATTPPDLHVVQSPQLFSNSNDARWESQIQETCSPGRNVGEIGTNVQLPTPDIMETSYSHQSGINMPPSILENFQDRFSYSDQEEEIIDNYNIPRGDRYNGNNEHYVGNLETITRTAKSKNFPQQVVNHVRNTYNSDIAFIPEELHYVYTKTADFQANSSSIERSNNRGSFRSSVQSLLKNDYQIQKQKNNADSDRMSESSDKNPYNFPYTAEEDHSSHTTTSLRRHEL